MQASNIDICDFRGNFGNETIVPKGLIFMVFDNSYYNNCTDFLYKKGKTK